MKWRIYKNVRVRAVLSALTPKVLSCTESFDNQQLSNTIFGLKNMNNDHPEVCAMLKALLVITDNCVADLTEEDIFSYEVGLQYMDRDLPEYIILLQSLQNIPSNFESYFKTHNRDQGLYQLLDDSISDPDTVQDD